MLQSLGSFLRANYRRFERWRSHKNSRSRAISRREKIIHERGGSCIDSSLLKEIKKYAEKRFGSRDYWPWLTLYTEIRGEFVEGWIPDDFYSLEFIPTVNPRPIEMLSTIQSYNHRLFGEFSVQPLAVRISGIFYDAEHNQLSNKQFMELMGQHNSEVVIKRDGGPSGRGLVFTKAQEVTDEYFPNGFDCVIQPYVRQHKVLARFSERSLNTLRIVTWLEKDHSVTVKYVILKYGVGEMRMDNMSAGGRFVIPDTNATIVSGPYTSEGLKADPPFECIGLKIPSFKEAVEACKKAHTLFPYLRLIGWDVCIDVEGEPKMIEWNARCPGIFPEEALIGPFWSQEEINGNMSVD